MAAAIGTTPTFVLTFEDEELDLTQMANVYVTFQSGGRTITKTGEDLTIEPKEISVWLSQEETLAFSEKVLVQANWTMNGGMRAASDIVTYSMSDQLLRKVVE